MGVTSDFIVQFFSSLDAPICVTALPNERGRGSPVTIYTRDADEIETFVQTNDKAEWAIYFCVNEVVEGKKRNKENIAKIGVLHSDLDFKGIVESYSVILNVLKHLPVKPTLVVFSGHGLHLYWTLATALPASERDRVEACLRQIARVLAGDPAVCEIARIMRLPGSHNTKGGEWIDVKDIGERGPVYDFEDLEKWFANADPVLNRIKPIEVEQSNGHDPDPESDAYDPWERYGLDYKDSLDPEVELGLMQYHDSTGHGIDRTQLRVLGHYTAQGGYNLDEIIDYIVAKTFKVVPESAKWHAGNRVVAEREEVNKLRDMFVRTFRKFPQHIEKQDKWPTWARKDRRLKHLLNGHGEDSEAQPAAAENVVQFPTTPKKPEKKLPVIRTMFLEELQTREVVELVWIVEGLVLAGTLNGLFGDGGVGKDLILFQLAIAMTCCTTWLGRLVKQGKVIYVTTEDDENELRRREERITRHYTVEESGTYEKREENLMIIPMLGEDTLLAVYDHQSGIVKPTPLYTVLCKTIEEFKPDLVIVGNRVNIFGVAQNDDAQARQCITLLNAICVKYNCAVMMPSHVSLRGAKDDGTSGSVQWSNGIRLRSFLKRINEDREKGEPETNPAARELEVMKSNWSARGEIITMEWKDGLFQVPDVHKVPNTKVSVTGEVIDMKTGEVLNEEQIEAQKHDIEAQRLQHEKDVENEFLKMLDKATYMKVKVSPKATSRTYAPTEFSRDSECRFRGKKGMHELQAAMTRLYASGTIQSVEYKSYGHLIPAVERVPR